MVHKLWISLSVIVLLFGCVGQQIVQDKPLTPEQCFESKFNPYRMSEWEPTMSRPPVHILKNPKVGELPDYVIIVVNMFGRIQRYAYLDGKNVMTYVIAKDKNGKSCYIAEKVTDDVYEFLHKELLKCRDGHEV